ncbi:N(4)-(beta-N-acetylglucosaminyl)-L-asparaginase [Mariniblastus fucicola]|uniref:N(4)-(Beta-N-acetylglucosaminyl)-L-asparaginase n=1 Tax=Mariniblastus fucicola TaxID=980251 RepID=A0A5B9PJ17_9BACT|nr:N(4)-(beta-N-acetylglucosaminyl)-L-asparaginase [Mariniblastus fucicola]QEG25260.1 N(4)-(Beta-N-acetylglucosaminyl)-L-asparaginase precursor [Mariniblastus fucicola]
MISRRHFIGTTAAVAAGSISASNTASANAVETTDPVRPVVISTWRHGLAANEAAWNVLSAGGSALDAAEQGVRVTESDPKVSSVGIGGWPDASGVVTLDACIMNEKGDCGSVAAMEEIENPITVARMVMEKTPHVMLVGKGAQMFAVENGIPKKNLLTPNAKAQYEKWKSAHPDAIKSRTINIENHDTIGLLTLDSQGNLSGACTTSGMAWKLPGRVGDSPIIGAGLYVDNEVGGATATGVGEAVIRACGSFLVVELMRQGNSPEDACRLAVERVISRSPDWKEIQVGFIAVNKQGEVGGFCIQPGFDYAVYDKAGGNRMFDGKSHVTK